MSLTQPAVGLHCHWIYTHIESVLVCSIGNAYVSRRLWPSWGSPSETLVTAHPKYQEYMLQRLIEPKTKPTRRWAESLFNSHKSLELLDTEGRLSFVAAG